MIQSLKQNIVGVVALLLAVLQNTSLVLLMRYSRVVEGPRYINSSAVVVAEVLKCIFCVIVLAIQSNFDFNSIKKEVFGNTYDMLRISIPSGIYAIQNNLLYFGLSNLDAPPYLITNQLKIFTTALFSVYMLNRHLTARKWFAITVLFCGVIVVQLQTLASGASSSAASDAQQSPLLGAAAVLVASITSGFAGVYFELILKNSAGSVWSRNLQMGLFGTVFACAIMLVTDYTPLVHKGFFFAWTPLVWTVVMNQAVGGLIIAVVVKYADNILKSFASSLSIVLASIISVFAFNFAPTFGFTAGACLVVVSVFIYQMPSPPPKTDRDDTIQP